MITDIIGDKSTPREFAKDVLAYALHRMELGCYGEYMPTQVNRLTEAEELKVRKQIYKLAERITKRYGL